MDELKTTARIEFVKILKYPLIIITLYIVLPHDLQSTASFLRSIISEVSYSKDGTLNIKLVQEKITKLRGQIVATATVQARTPEESKKQSEQFEEILNQVNSLSEIFANQSPSIETRTTIKPHKDSYNSFATSNNEAIKKVIISQKQDYPNLTQAQYNAMITLAGESLKIDMTNKAKSEKIKECENVGASLQKMIFVDQNKEFFDKKCEEFFK